MTIHQYDPNNHDADQAPNAIPATIDELMNSKSNDKSLMEWARNRCSDDAWTRMTVQNMTRLHTPQFAQNISNSLLNHLPTFFYSSVQKTSSCILDMRYIVFEALE